MKLSLLIILYYKKQIENFVLEKIGRKSMNRFFTLLQTDLIRFFFQFDSYSIC